MDQIREIWLCEYMDLLDKQRHWVPGDAVITLVVPAMSWLVASGAVALTAYGAISGGVVGVVGALSVRCLSDPWMCIVIE